MQLASVDECQQLLSMVTLPARVKRDLQHKLEQLSIRWLLLSQLKFDFFGTCLRLAINRDFPSG
ncbi:hypothetical protein [Microcoleus vaginatus]|uniref:hypothetical protein n=1 Tax=Microcoleus vaginatus TaxID=119532 RepID=UPI0016882394|nr:hypothetical protein [Microcoleus sp. FACHB-84]MBD2010783.1 hypothetical protein [Microcoleus sp. FACHB-45]